MPSTFTNSLRLVKQAAGENASTWGTVFNQQFADLIDTAIAGYATKALSDADTTLVASNGVADESRAMFLRFTGTLTQMRNVIVPTASKLYVIANDTTQALTIKTSAGTGVLVRVGGRKLIACDGTNVVETITSLANGTTVSDGTNTYSVGYLDIPQNSQSADYTLVLSDAGKHIYHPTTDTSARLWTIPANSSVPFPVGTTITFINDAGAGAISIAITSDTLTLAGSGSTGARSLVAPANATAVKVTATRWIISGTGIS